MDKLQREKVLLKKVGKEVFLNFISLADDKWMNERFGEGALAKAFDKNNPNMDVVLAVFWRLLDTEDKRLIMDIKFNEVVAGPDGKALEKEIIYTDPVKKLWEIISGSDEVVAIYFAFLAILQKSSPEKLLELKKKEFQTMFPRPPQPETSSVTPSSAITSMPSTDGVTPS